MSHRCEASAADLIRNLRHERVSGTIDNETQFSPRIYFSWDSDCEVEVRADAREGALLSCTVDIAGAPGWVTLNVDLGPGRFRAGDVVGLLVETRDGKGVVLSAFIRTADGDGGLHDTELGETPALSAAPQIFTILHQISEEDPILASDNHHTLILRLPVASFGLTLVDLRLFVVPSDRLPAGMRPAMQGPEGE